VRGDTGLKIGVYRKQRVLAWFSGIQCSTPLISRGNQRRGDFACGKHSPYP